MDEFSEIIRWEVMKLKNLSREGRALTEDHLRRLEILARVKRTLEIGSDGFDPAAAKLTDEALNSELAKAKP
jgi:uncharacterized protein YerC